MATADANTGGSYGATSISDSARAHLGDEYTYGNKIYIQNAQFGAVGNLSRHGEESRGNIIAMPGKGIALLSLDCDFRNCLGTLEVLKQFAKSVANIQGCNEPLKPCDFFDMICGYGVGGIVAIMLGRLDMSIDDCQIFLKSILSFLQCDSSTHIPLDTNTNNHNEDLYRALKAIMDSSDTSANELFANNAPSACKVFVCVGSPIQEELIVLSSYRTSHRNSDYLRYLTIYDTMRESVSGTCPSDFVIPSKPCNLVPALCVEAIEVLLDYGQRLHDHLDCILSVGRFPPAYSKPVPQLFTSTSSLSDFSRRNTSSSSSAEVDYGYLLQQQFFCHLVPSENTSDLGRKSEQTAFQYLVALLDRSSQVEQLKQFLRMAADHKVVANTALITPLHGYLNQYNRESQDQSLMDKISNYDPTTENWRRSCLRIKGTCSWIFQNKHFLEWQLSQHSAVLSCVGTVGCGKSLLACVSDDILKPMLMFMSRAALIDHLKEAKLSSKNSCIHFFFDNNQKIGPTLNDLLRALIKQGLDRIEKHHGILPDDLKIEVSRHFGEPTGCPSTAHLLSLLEDVMDRIPNTLFIIDGFEALTEEETLRMFEAIRRCFTKNKPHSSKLALFSREILGRGIDVRKQVPESHHLRLNLSHLQKDIETFVDTQVELMQMKRVITENDELLHEIRTKLKANSERMFLWIHFQLLNIWNPRLSTCDDDIRSIIDNLPIGLEDTYRQCLLRIEHHENEKYRQIANNAFRWVASARRPLTSRQLREAVSLDSSKVELQESNILNACATEYCANLLTVDVMGMVQFTHPTVRQFLGQPHNLADELTGYCLHATNDDLWCGSICLAYLNMLQLPKQVAIRHETQVSIDLNNSIKFISRAHPVISKFSSILGRRVKPSAQKASLPARVRFVTQPVSLELHSYILFNWLEHIRGMDNHCEAFSLLDKICRFRDPEIWPWAGKHSSTTPFYTHMLDHAIYLNHQILAHEVYQCLVSFTDAKLIRKRVFEGARFDSNIYPIHIAAALGHDAMVQELLNSGCTVDVWDAEGKSPLCWAAENLHGSAMMTLLKTASSSINTCQKPDISPWTILAGLPDQNLFFSVLGMKHSNFSDDQAMQILYVACLKGHVIIVKHLMENYLTQYGLLLRCTTGYGGREISFEPRLFAVTNRHIELTLFFFPETTRFDVDGILSVLQGLRFSREALETFWFLRDNAVFNVKINDRSAEAWMAYAVEILKATDQSKEVFEWHEIVRCIHDMIGPQSFLDSQACAIMCQVLLEIPTTPDDIILRLVDRTSSQITNSDAIEALRALSRQRPPRIALALEDLFVHDCAKLVEECMTRENYDQSKSEFDRHLHYLYIYAAVQSTYSLGLMNEHMAMDKMILHQLRMQGIPVLEEDYFFDYETFPHQGSIWNVCSLPTTVRHTSILVESLRVAARRRAYPVDIYRDLIDAKSDGVFTPNFPAGYWKVGNKWSVKLSIVGAFYRWNWRLRREKELPLSAADIAYLKAVPDVWKGWGGLVVENEPGLHRWCFIEC